LTERSPKKSEEAVEEEEEEEEEEEDDDDETREALLCKKLYPKEVLALGNRAIPSNVLPLEQFSADDVYTQVGILTLLVQNVNRLPYRSEIVLERSLLKERRFFHPAEEPDLSIDSEGE
jgi:hypothetical protein